MVENRRLLIALAAVLVLGVVARFALTSVHTSEGVYYASIPDELPDFTAREVYVCPECLREHEQAYMDLLSHKPADDRLEKYPPYYARPGPDGRCPNHPDVPMMTTTEIPVSPRVKISLPEDTEYTNREYFPRDPQRSAFPTSIELTVVVSSTDRRSIHRAESCLRAQKWEPGRDAYHTTIPIADDPDRTMTVRSLLMWNEVPTESGQTARWNLVVVYWYAALPDRITSSEYRRLALMFYDRLVRGLNYRWCYVLVSKRFPPGVSEDAISEELEKFVAQFTECAEVGQASK